MPYFNAYLWRYALSISVAILLAFAMNYFYSLSHGSWMVLSALCVSVATRGAPLRQGMMTLLALCAGLIVGALLMHVLGYSFALLMILSLLCIFVAMLAMREPGTNDLWLPAPSVFFVICLLATLSMPQSELVQRIVDMGVGAVIGMVCVQWIFPSSVVDDFVAGVVPILKGLTGMSQAFVACYAPKPEPNLLHAKSIAVEKILEQRAYPTWAYEVGFNPGLRAGFRFFLLHLERLIEGLFALRVWVQQPVHLQDEALRVAIHESLQKNEELCAALWHYFANHTYPAFTHDLTTDIESLEKCLQQLVPPKLALLEVSADYVTLTALVRQIKDNRRLLIQLLDTLPNHTMAKQN